MGIVLKKGQSSVYFVYLESAGTRLGAKEFEAILEDGIVVIRFQVSPVDENQRIDERRLSSETLSQIHIDDDYIIENLQRFLRQPYVDAKELRVQIISEGSFLNFSASIGAVGVGMLPLLVTRVAT